MLTVTSLKKKYGNFLALDIPEISIPGGIFWLQGENGSGKTTLLKILAGLLSYEGNINLEQTGDEKRNRVIYRKKVNYGEAEPVYPSFLTGYDLIRLYEQAKGAQHETSLLAELFGIHEYAGKTLKNYSSGMMKKLSLFLALIGDPELILLDEPLITLDTKAVEFLCKELSKIKDKNPKLTILFTSHQAPTAEALPLQGIYLAANKTIHFCPEA